MSKLVKVVLAEEWERDSWSGPNKLQTKEFTGPKAKEKAEAWCKKINSKNTAPSAPEYYIEAHIVKEYETQR
jgi:hypothetical protein